MKRLERVYLILCIIVLVLHPPPAISQNSPSTICPLNFSIAEPYVSSAASSPPSDLCAFSRQILHLVESDFLLTSNLFVPPSPSAASCWSALSSLLTPLSISLPSSCGFSTLSISAPCMNISSRADFAAVIPTASLADLNRSCDRPLSSSSFCTACTTTLDRIKASYLPGPDVSNVTDCASYPFIYAAAAANRFGPRDPSNANCLFFLPFPSSSSPTSSGSGSSAALPAGIAGGACALVFLAAFCACYFLHRRRHRRRGRLRKQRLMLTRPEGDRLQGSIGASTTLIKFSFDEIRLATMNFSRENIIGHGGYGNVYKGILKDGSEVAVKRFKNCSTAGDGSFVHEVEVIASVRHVNLVALRGYCTATTSMEGHQRIIVCELMPNGSLHDHLFGFAGQKLSWPARQKIAAGTARGLAYLHHSSQPAIIHRDIKASNILLDENFEAKLADFGLARYAPEGVSHVSTRVAGTLGYVAPEYALYGQLTEKSDVFSYGVVMLELLSGKKALITKEDGQNWLVTDWAWSLVKKGETLDVIDEEMEELGPKEVMEKYVLVAVLCSHPLLHARPTMDQVVKILESDLSVPSIPDRPLSIIANKDDIERSMSSSSSGQFFSPGYKPYSLRRDESPIEGSEIL
ncbi:putative LRR receptor-like serine/threonine-protein kinase RKF3 [Apostasia shenzhenica]|uniref:non-specific serine/threonine protein kinase n=1 Tax=Apostasia shenzhenica TaxID=1088818 RepID=A0A2I0AUW2_9ASPA|nr:putative LRR receptor-like serine/threonine-protein kinase RKF3 [Apostasia shenzhenica]